MKTGSIIGLVVAAAIVIAVGAYMIDFNVTEEGSMPEVSVEGGNMPEVEADVGDVDVGTTTETIEVPTVDVTPPEENSN
ncbi:hypothetical protein ACFSDD_15405 [Salipiger marinus]|uniref:Uncharacterized protein n=1 Tax=Salipiger marinus TaxID=555512 RepID=A0A1G8L7C4_9RHOB|nr:MULTISPECIES: hypothetical protein [Salipiger]MCD1617781.1 hypothetical protein [Salipiger manganoxidans]MEB3418313.1 hypothetical protein [Salipiger manganoxidans]SDI51614.1 hypothetical protein SAMN04487993_10069 [Salipiger marinus]HBT00458.1 hypothetical protein [Citreicella sp.]